MFDPEDKATPGHYGPSQTALLLLDFHQMFVDKAGGAKAPQALKVAAEMRTWAQTHGIRVIHALIDVDQSPFETCKDGTRLAAVTASMKVSGGEESVVLLEGGRGEDVTFTRKPGYVSALKSTGLEDFLRDNGIKSLILTGLSTSGCVMRTAVNATDAEYVVSVIADACADPVEGVHELMIRGILIKRGFVFTSKEFCHGFEKCITG